MLPTGISYEMTNCKINVSEDIPSEIRDHVCEDVHKLQVTIYSVTTGCGRNESINPLSPSDAYMRQ